MFILTKKDRCILSGWGYSEKSIAQIEEATRMMIFTAIKAHKEVRISRAEAIRRLGRENFLSGISRAAFHWDADRQSEDGHHVYFDAKKYFAEV